MPAVGAPGPELRPWSLLLSGGDGRRTLTPLVSMEEDTRVHKCVETKQRCLNMGQKWVKEEITGDTPPVSVSKLRTTSTSVKEKEDLK